MEPAGGVNEDGAGPSQQLKPLADPQPMQEGDHASAGSNRLAILNDTFNKCLQYGLREPGVKGIEACFPDLKEPVIVALYDLYKQVLEQVEAHSQAEFTDICNEYGMADKLAELDELQARTEAVVLTARPTEAVTQAAESAAWQQAKQLEVTNLQQQLAQAVLHRQRIQEDVNKKQATVNQLLGAYQSAAADVQKVYEASCSSPRNSPCDSPRPIAIVGGK